MTKHLRSLVLIGAISALSACADSWNQQAGAFIDEGGFGNPTMHNTQAMSCRGKAKGYILPEPVVVLNPDSPKSPQVGIPAGYSKGRVQCSGDLNGKYAQVIFEEYVESATELPPGGAGGLAEIASAGG